MFSAKYSTSQHLQSGVWSRRCESPESGFWPIVGLFLLRETLTTGTYNESYNKNFACTLLCTFYLKNLDRLSIHPEIHNQYITHDILESESEIWATSQSHSPGSLWPESESESHKNKDFASLSASVLAQVCVHHCIQLLYKTQHRTVLIIFPLTLQTIIIAQMMPTGGERVRRRCCSSQQCNLHSTLFPCWINDNTNPRKPAIETTLDLITLCVQVKSQNGFARTLNGSDALSNFPVFMRLCRGSMISLLMQISRVLKSVLPTSWPYRQTNRQCQCDLQLKNLLYYSGFFSRLYICNFWKWKIKNNCKQLVINSSTDPYKSNSKMSIF